MSPNAYISDKKEECDPPVPFEWSKAPIPFELYPDREEVVVVEDGCGVRELSGRSECNVCLPNGARLR